jgi:hypothetical protein
MPLAMIVLPVMPPPHSSAVGLVAARSTTL